MKKSMRNAVTLTLLMSIFFYYGNNNVAFANTESKEVKLTKNTDIKSDKNDSGENVNTNIDLTPKYHKTRGLYGYVDSKGNWVIEPKFNDARNFSEGVAAVDDSSSINNWGYIFPDGTYAIEPKFNGAFNFNNDFAIVGDKAFVALINKKGEYTLRTKYYWDTRKTSDYIASVITDVSPSEGQKKHKYGIITSEGVLVEPQFDTLPDLNDNFVCFF